jgi:hypothetical protein
MDSSAEFLLTRCARPEIRISRQLIPMPRRRLRRGGNCGHENRRLHFRAAGPYPGSHIRNDRSGYDVPNDQGADGRGEIQSAISPRRKLRDLRGAAGTVADNKGEPFCAARNVPDAIEDLGRSGGLPVRWRSPDMSRLYAKTGPAFGSPKNRAAAHRQPRRTSARRSRRAV